MKIRKPTAHMFDVFFILALFCVFAASAMLAVAIGATVYRTATNNLDANFESRTATSYLTEKIRHNDRADAIHLTELDGAPCIALDAVYESVSYTTYLYVWDGYLCEYLARTSEDISPEYGEQILPVQEFTAEQISDSLYRLTLTEEKSGTHTLYVTLRCSANENRISPEGEVQP